MVTAKHKPMVDAQKIKRGQSEHTNKVNHQFTQIGREEETAMELQISQQAVNMMALVSPCL